MKKQAIAMLIVGAITSQLIIPTTVTFADTTKGNNKNTTKITENKSVKTNTLGVYTDASMTQELKNPNQYMYPKEVTLNFNGGTATVDGKEIKSGTKITEAGVHILKITNGNESRTYNFSVINNINGRNIVSFSTGGPHVAAVDDEGNLYTWGLNRYGQLGDGTRTDKHTPVKINGKGDIGSNTKIISVSIGKETTSAIDSEGNLYTWGYNSYGQLGDGTRTDKHTPVKINGKGDIGINTKIISISMGVNSSSAIDSEGNLYTWGNNSCGQLGDGTTTHKYTPVKINGKGDIGNNTKIISVSVGEYYANAVDSEGNLYTWGNNSDGQLGDGTRTDKHTPVKINGKGDIGNNTKITSTSTGWYSSSAIDSEGNLYTWGNNNYGQLGDGTTTHKYTPVKINGKGDIGNNTKIISVSLGKETTSAIDSEGNLYTWGNNFGGQLGDGTTIHKYTPVKINGKGCIGNNTKIISASMGAYSSSAIDSEGNLYIWGYNSYGEAGNGTIGSCYYPVETILTLDYDNITRREDSSNVYFDVKVPNASSATRIAYKLEGDSDFKYVNVNNGVAKIIVSKSTNAKKIHIQLGVHVDGKNQIVENVNNKVTLSIEGNVDTNKATSKLAYFKPYGIVLEGAVSGDEKYDDTVKKSLVIKGSDGSVKLKKDIVSTNWYGDGYSGFQAILTPKDMSDIGNIKDAKIEIEVNNKGTVKNYEYKVDIPADGGSGDGSGGQGNNPTIPNVPPTIKPGTDIGWTSDYYHIQDLPKSEYGNNVVSFTVDKSGNILLTNSVKSSGFNIISYYKTSKGEYAIDVAVKIDGFDMTNEHENILEVKDKKGQVVHTGDVATFADGVFPGVAPKSALQAIVPKEYSNDNYTFDIVIKDKNNVEKARFTAPKYF